MTIDLYRVTTIAQRYHDLLNVSFAWFVDRRPYPVALPYGELIENYDELEDGPGSYRYEAIDELFLKAEADALCAWLKEHEHEGDTTEVTKFEPPLPADAVGFGALAVGGGPDFYMLYETPEYSLPFRVLGYFDLRQHEYVGQRGPARHEFPDIVVHNGEMITDYEELLKLWEAGTLSVPGWGS